MLFIHENISHGSGNITATATLSTNTFANPLITIVAFFYGQRQKKCHEKILTVFHI